MSYSNTINDAIERLKLEYEVDISNVTHIENRYFSSIYELTADKYNGGMKYILKISNTERSCRDEFEAYVYLNEVNILSLTPMLFSEQFNYLITVKEKLIDLPTALKSSNNEICISYMQKLGKLVKDLEIKTGQVVKFNKHEYDEYVIPRMMGLKSISLKSKEQLISKVCKLSSQFENKEIISSIVTDLNLGNLHLNENNEFVLLDMGDAYRDDCYGNIVTIYHSIKYGPLQKRIENKRKTANLFNGFMEGYGDSKLSKMEFNLYRIKSLVCMLLFVERLEVTNKSLIRKTLSMLSNRLLLRKLYNNIYEILEVAYE